ncbi:MAG: DNA polymerase III subunit delta' [Ktedonobacterales bacterium]
MQGVVGNRHAQTQLERALRSGQVGHAYLLTGPRAIGKTTLALAFAAALECQQRAPDSVEACGVCAACRKIAHGNHPDVALITPAVGKRLFGIDQIREIIHLANLSPSEGAWRVFILPEIERMEDPAANALLKTLEEPPEGIVLLLTTNEPENLLPTILSRCQMIPMQPLAPDEIITVLTDRWGVAPEEAQRLAALANGRLGWAVEAHEQPELREQRDDLLQQLMALTYARRDERLRRAATLASDTEAARQALDLWMFWWRDVTLAACGSQRLVTTGASRAQAERQGRALGAERAEAFLRALLAAQTALDQNANPRLTLEVLLLDLPTLPRSPR